MVRLCLAMNVYGPAMSGYECLWSSYDWLCMFMVRLCLAMNVMVRLCLAMNVHGPSMSGYVRYGPSMSGYECLWSVYVWL